MMEGLGQVGITEQEEIQTEEQSKTDLYNNTTNNSFFKDKIIKNKDLALKFSFPEGGIDQQQFIT